MVSKWVIFNFYNIYYKSKARKIVVDLVNKKQIVTLAPDVAGNEQVIESEIQNSEYLPMITDFVNVGDLMLIEIDLIKKTFFLKGTQGEKEY